ncbi:MAG: UPF0489 family protein [Deltaproteobacteria bacterium]
MDTNRIAKWLKEDSGWLHPPGCESTFVKLPGRDSGCCTVGIVNEHRFAFYFWGLCASDKDSRHAALISIDAHDDVGVPTEVIQDDLDNLNIHNRTELGLFAWLRLRSLNDGHILPALYLNFFSDVYVLMNGREDSAAFRTSRTEQRQRDRDGCTHKVKYYRNSKKLLHDLPKKNCPLFLDIDLDYFAIENRKAGSVLGSENLMSDAEIRSFLSINGPLLKPILNRIVGLTIALEPKYCGGLVNSLHVLDILNQELFEGTLCTNSCKWKRANNP